VITTSNIRHLVKLKERSSMNPDDPVHVLCTLFGITPADLGSANKVLGIDAAQRSPAAIEDAARGRFARVQSVQQRVSPEMLQWMMQVVTNARIAMLQAAVAAPTPPPQPAPPAWAQPTPPQVPAASYSAAPAYESPVVVRPYPPRYDRGLTLDNLAGAVGGLVMCGFVVAGVGWFATQSWQGWQKKPVPGGGSTLGETAVVVKVVGGGGGKPTPPKPNPKPGPVPTPPPRPAPVPVVGDSKATLQKALELARQGSFTEARRVAERSHRELPDESDGLSYLISYAEQYSSLADEARLALNGNNAVDLGSPYEQAQFVEQTSEKITFFANGKHKSFSIKEFNTRKGVRFRVFRNYLDNAEIPANDLIIGAYQFLLRVNERGEQDANGGVPEAKSRIGKAITGGDPETIEHGTLMMKAIELLAAAQ
jgi:hypothetical protein